MSYIRFEKALMTNLQESLSKELLRTNRSDAQRIKSSLEAKGFEVVGNTIRW